VAVLKTGQGLDLSEAGTRAAILALAETERFEVLIFDNLGMSPLAPASLHSE
jgi:hypothetical protein